MEPNDPSNTSTSSTGSKKVTYASLADEFNRSPSRHGFMNSGVTSSKGEDFDSRFAIIINSAEDIPQQFYADAVSDMLKCPSALTYIGRRSNRLVIYLNKVSYVQAVVSSGIYVKNKYVRVNFLEAPIKKVVLSNVNPDVPNGLLINYLKKYGQIVEEPKPMSAGLKGKLSHVRSLRRECGMILSDGITDVDDSFEFTRGKFTHRIFVATGGLICFECRKRGHTRNYCPTLRNQQQHDAPAQKKKDDLEVPKVDDDGFQTVRGRRTRDGRKTAPTSPTIELHAPQLIPEEEETPVETTAGTVETSLDRSSDISGDTSDKVLKKTNDRNKIKSSARSKNSAKFSDEASDIVKPDVVLTDKSTVMSTSSATVVTTVTTSTVKPLTVNVTNTVPSTVSSNVNYNILDPKPSAPIFTVTPTVTKTTSLISTDDFPPLITFSDEVNMTLETPPPPNIKRSRADSFPELEEAEPPFKQHVVLTDEPPSLPLERSDSLSSLSSSVSLSSSILCDESEAEEMAELAAQQDLTIPPHSQEEVLSFFISMKNKKNQLSRCEDFYPDLRYLLRQLNELKLITGMATTNKKRLYKLTKLIRTELLQRKRLNSAVTDNDIL